MVFGQYESRLEGRHSPEQDAREEIRVLFDAVVYPTDARNEVSFFELYDLDTGNPISDEIFRLYEDFLVSEVLDIERTRESGRRAA